MGGRGSGIGTKYLHADDMTEKELDKEIARFKRMYRRDEQVVRTADKETEQKKIAKAWDEQQEIRKKIHKLLDAKSAVRGSGKTRNQIRKESKDGLVYASGTWTKTRTGNQVVHSNGEYTIKRNTGGLYGLYRADGTYVTDGRTINEAKAYATLDRDERRRRR